MAEFECVCVASKKHPNPADRGFKAGMDWGEKPWCLHALDARWFSLKEWEAKHNPLPASDA